MSIHESSRRYAMILSSIAGLLVLVGVFGSTLHASDREGAFDLNEQAVQAINEGRPADAAALLVEAHRMLPDNDVIRNNLAEAKFRVAAGLCDTGRYAAALAPLQEAIALQPTRAQLHLFLGVSRYHLGQLEEAEKALRKALSLSPSESAAYENLGHVLYKQGRSEDAIEAWETAIAKGTKTASLRRLADRVKRETEVERQFLESRTTHFDIRYDGAIQRTVLESVHRELESAYDRVGEILSHHPEDAVPVVLYSRSGFSRVTEGHRWVAGLFDGRIRIPVDRESRSGRSRIADQIGDTLVHEYTHYVIHDLSPRCPTWLHEGVAQWIEGRGLAEANRRLARARALDRLSPVLQLTRSFAKTEDPDAARLQYDQALSFVGFLVERYGGAAVIPRLLRALTKGKDVDVALKETLGIEASAVEAAWLEWLG